MQWPENHTVPIGAIATFSTRMLCSLADKTQHLMVRESWNSREGALCPVKVSISITLWQWRSQSAAVARAQHGHTMLRVTSCLGPAQPSAAYSTEMKKQLGGFGGCLPRKFLSFLGRFWGYFRPYRCLELEHFDNAFATNLRARSVRSLWYLRQTHIHRDQRSLWISLF